MEDLASELDGVRWLLGLSLHGFPAPSSLYRSFDRARMYVWRSLLNQSFELLDRSGHAENDSTFFNRWRASPHYLRRIDRKVDTLKITPLFDTENQAILYVHYSVIWPNDAKVEPNLAARNIDQQESLAADKGYESAAIGRQLPEHGVRTIIKHRHYRSIVQAHNPRMDEDRYNQW